MSYFFILDTLNEYLERKTSFHVTVDEIQLDDHPTVTLCFDHPHLLAKSNITVKALQTPRLPRPTNVTYRPVAWTDLQEGANLMRDHQGHVRTVGLEILHVNEERSWVRSNCVKISQRYLNHSDNLGMRHDDFSRMVGEFLFRYDRTDVYNSTVATLYFTTEDNSYGAVERRWYDGNVQPYTLRQGHVQYIAISYLKQMVYLGRLIFSTFSQVSARKYVTQSVKVMVANFSRESEGSIACFLLIFLDKIIAQI